MIGLCVSACCCIFLLDLKVIFILTATATASSYSSKLFPTGRYSHQPQRLGCGYDPQGSRPREIGAGKSRSLAPCERGAGRRQQDGCVHVLIDCDFGLNCCVVVGGIILIAINKMLTFRFSSLATTINYCYGLLQSSAILSTSCLPGSTWCLIRLLVSCDLDLLPYRLAANLR